MAYAIVGYFDSISDKKVKGLWKGFADIGIDDYLINSSNNPHIKFAMFESLDLDAAQKELYSLLEKIQKINIHFKKYGIYPNDKPFITIDIADNIEIIKLQMDIYNTIRNADRILYIANKGIAEEGTQEDLMKLKGLYYSLN